MSTGFNRSFEKGFLQGADDGAKSARESIARKSATDLELLKEQIKTDAEKAEKANKLAALKSAGVTFAEKAIASGSDPEVVGMFADALNSQKDPDVAEKIYTAAITNAAQQAKDKNDFNQVMTQEKYKSGMLGVTEVIKSLAERGGTFADGTPITASSLQDFGQTASQRILNSIGGGQAVATQATGTQQVPGQASTAGQTSIIEPSTEVAQSNSGSMMNAPIPSKASLLAEDEKAKQAIKSEAELAKSEKEGIKRAEATSKGTYRFMQQFERSLNELKKFDPEIEKVGVGGWLSRKQASIAEHLDELPETKALKIQIQPLANGMAREIEGGKITDQDRKIYADSFANAISNPGPTNVRNMSSSIIRLLDKGGNETGKITNQLKMLANKDVDIFNNVLAQVLEDYPELVKEIYGEDYEVVE